MADTPRPDWLNALQDPPGAIPAEAILPCSSNSIDVATPTVATSRTTRGESNSRRTTAPEGASTA